jgi:non-heme chloroperoxidase
MKLLQGLAVTLMVALAPVVYASEAATMGRGLGEGYVNTDDGARIHYLQAGQDSAAPALVLIPGWMLTASLWREQLQRFSDHRRVIAVDSRSQGASSIMLTGNTPERRAQDLHELLASLHVDRCVLVGWSQGAQDVAAYVQQFGTASLAGIVFVDSPMSAGNNELDLRKAFSKAILTGLSRYAADPADYSAGTVRSIFLHPPADIDAVIKQAQRTPPAVGAAMLVSDIFGADRRPALQKIDRPALVIASASSPLLDAQRQMAESIRGAVFITLPNTRHALFVDEPKAFDGALALLLRAADSTRM